MKQFFLIAICIFLLFSVDAQSKMITGTLLPKKGNTIVYLPNAVTGVDTGKSQNDIISTNSNFFIFNKPVVQSPKIGSTYQPQDYQSQFSIDSTKNIFANGQPPSIISQVIRKVYAANEPLVYEAPPTIFNNAKTNVVEQLQPLVYEAPPSITKSSNVIVPANINSQQMQSPKFKGEYKATLKQSILMVPVSQEDIEKSMAKSKSVAVDEEKKVVVQAPKYVEDLYPPLNYTVPAKGNNLRSPVIAGTYSPTKNNPVVFVPVVPIATSNSSNTNEVNITQQYSNNTKSVIDELKQRSSKTSQPRKVDIAEASIFDDNTNSAYKKLPSYIPAELHSVNVASASIFDDNTNPSYKQLPAYTSSKLQSVKTYNGKFQKPIKKSYKKQTQLPTAKNNIGIKKFQIPIKQSNNLQPNSTSIFDVKPIDNTNIFGENIQPQVISDNNKNNDYKFYVNPNGKYNILCYGNGSTITITNFGRVIDYTLPSSSNVSKPTSNYKGLIESVGNLPLQYTYEGRVAAVGSTNISYNYDGAINKVGNTPIYYNYNGTVDKIGISKIAYNENGSITSVDKNPMILVKQ